MKFLDAFILLVDGAYKIFSRPADLVFAGMVQPDTGASPPHHDIFLKTPSCSKACSLYCWRAMIWPVRVDA